MLQVLTCPSEKPGAKNYFHQLLLLIKFSNSNSVETRVHEMLDTALIDLIMFPSKTMQAFLLAITDTVSVPIEYISERIIFYGIKLIRLI